MASWKLGLCLVLVGAEIFQPPATKGKKAKDKTKEGWKGEKLEGALSHQTNLDHSLPWAECALTVVPGSVEYKAELSEEIIGLRKHCSELKGSCWGDHSWSERLFEEYPDLHDEKVMQLCEETGMECGGKTKASAFHDLHVVLADVPNPTVPEGGVRVCHAGLAMGYDVLRRNPAWVQYRLNAAEQRRADNERKGFTLDPAVQAYRKQIPKKNKKLQEIQTKESAYANTNFDRGHMAPSRSMSFDHALLDKAKNPSPWQSCYFMSNIAPQAMRFNRESWESLEETEHTYAKDKKHDLGHDVFVTVGVAYWDPAYAQQQAEEMVARAQAKAAGNSEEDSEEDGGLIVPTFFYKVICDPEAGGSFAVIGENDDTTDDKVQGWPFSFRQKLYSAHDVENFFGIKLNMPAVCKPDKVSYFLLDERGQNLWQPKAGLVPTDEIPDRFTVTQVAAGDGHSCPLIGNSQRIRMKAMFGPDADGVQTLKIEAPKQDDGSKKTRAAYTFRCSDVVPINLPAGWDCDDTHASELTFSWVGKHVIKGGYFDFEVSVDMPEEPFIGQSGAWRATANVVVHGTGHGHGKKAGSKAAFELESRGFSLFELSRAPGEVDLAEELARIPKKAPRKAVKGKSSTKITAVADEGDDDDDDEDDHDQVRSVARAMAWDLVLAKTRTAKMAHAAAAAEAERDLYAAQVEGLKQELDFLRAQLLAGQDSDDDESVSASDDESLAESVEDPVQNKPRRLTVRSNG